MSALRRYLKYKESGANWLGAVPAHWRVERLDWSFDERREKASDRDFAALSVTKGGVVPQIESVAKTDDGDNRKKVCAGDFVINARSDRRGSSGLAATDGTVSVVYTVLKPRGIHEGFAHHLLRSYAFQEEYYRVGNGLVADLWTTSYGDMRTILLALPPKQEQVRIAQVLDRETARIDALIEKKTRFIELLREKRQALITSVVTTGLNPGTTTKESGVEWMPQIPKHWDVKQLKHVVDPSSSITYGIVQAGPEYEGGIPYIKTSDMAGDTLPNDGYSRTSPSIEASFARSRVRPGDLVMSIRASIGKCLPVPDSLPLANLTQGTAKISPGPLIDKAFLLTFIQSDAAQTYFDTMAKGATFKEITLDALRRTPVLLPPIDEQVQVSAYVAETTSAIDSLIAKSARSIDLLKERRAALITAAVTGQIDVRTEMLIEETEPA